MERARFPNRLVASIFLIGLCQVMVALSSEAEENGNDSEFYALTGIADSHYVSIELLSLTTKKIFGHFPMDGHGAPEFLLEVSLDAIFPADPARDDAARRRSVPVATIFMGEGFNVLEPGGTVILPEAVLRDGFDAIKIENQRPDRLELVMELVEDDRAKDDWISDYVYTLVPRAPANSRIDLLYTAWSMEVDFEAAININASPLTKDPSYFEISIENPRVSLASEAAARQMKPGADAIEPGVMRRLMKSTLLKAIAAFLALSVTISRSGQLSEDKVLSFLSLFAVVAIVTLIDSILQAVEWFALGGLGGGNFWAPMIVLRCVVALLILRSFYEVGISEIVLTSGIFCSILFALTMSTAAL